jgi:hypothetical protein
LACSSSGEQVKNVAPKDSTYQQNIYLSFWLIYLSLWLIYLSLWLIYLDRVHYSLITQDCHNLSYQSETPPYQWNNPVKSKYLFC